MVLYLVASGGNAGAGTNSAIEMAAVAGLSTALPASVTINEFSTIGAEWALQQFTDAATGSVIGTSATNSTGFSNAFNQLAANLVDLGTGAPGALLESIAASCGTGSPAVNCGGLEQMNTIANILAACIATSSGSTECTTLLSKATPPGGLTPLNTLGAAADIARNPTNNVAALFALNSSALPYAPALTSAPNDFSLALNFAQTSAGFSDPARIALDAAGDVFVANEAGGVSDDGSVSELTAASGHNSGFRLFPPGSDFSEPFSLAVDESGNLWFANLEGSTVSELVGVAVPVTTPLKPGGPVLP